MQFSVNAIVVQPKRYPDIVHFELMQKAQVTAASCQHWNEGCVAILISVYNKKKVRILYMIFFSLRAVDKRNEQRVSEGVL